MKLRLRLGKRTSVISLADGEPTLANLTTLAKEAFAVSECSLSLNGQDLLDGDGNATLAELGIVSGDLVHVLTNDPAAGAAQPVAEPKTHERDSNVSKVLKVDLAPCTSRNVTNNDAAKDIPSTSGAAKEEEEKHLPDASPMDFKDAECIRDEHVNRYLHEPTAIQDSTEAAVPQSLEQIYCDNKPCDAQDACVLVLHILMSETGFRRQGSSKSKSSGLLASCKKTGRYEMVYTYPMCPDILFQLIVVPMGSLLIAHGQVQGGDLNIKLNVQIKTMTFIKGIHESACQTYKSLPWLARLFKDSLSHPLINRTRTELGLHASNTFLGLMYEIKILVLKKLDGKSLCQLSATCSELQSLCHEPKLWRTLYLKEFGRRNNSELDQDWFQFYKDKHMQREAMRERMRHYTVLTPPFMNHPYPPLPFAPTYPPGFIGGDFDLDPRFPQGLFGPVPPLLPRPRFDPIGPIPNPLFRPGRGGGMMDGVGNQRRSGRGGGFYMGPPGF